jgi:hypothetical protein
MSVVEGDPMARVCGTGRIADQHSVGHHLLKPGGALQNRQQVDRWLRLDGIGRHVAVAATHRFKLSQPIMSGRPALARPAKVEVDVW